MQNLNTAGKLCFLDLEREEPKEEADPLNVAITDYVGDPFKSHDPYLVRNLVVTLDNCCGDADGLEDELRKVRNLFSKDKSFTSKKTPLDVALKLRRILADTAFSLRRKRAQNGLQKLFLQKEAEKKEKEAAKLKPKATATEKSKEEDHNCGLNQFCSDRMSVRRPNVKEVFGDRASDGLSKQQVEESGEGENLKKLNLKLTNRMAYWAPYHAIPVSRRYQADSKTLGMKHTFSLPELPCAQSANSDMEEKKKDSKTGANSNRNKELRVKLQRWQQKLLLPGYYRSRNFHTLRSCTSVPALQKKKQERASIFSSDSAFSLTEVRQFQFDEDELAPTLVKEALNGLRHPEALLKREVEPAPPWSMGIRSDTPRSTSSAKTTATTPRTPRNRTPRTHEDPGEDKCLVEDNFRPQRLATTEAMYPSPEGFYFNACLDSKVLPTMPSFLVHRTGRVNLARTISSVSDFKNQVTAIENLERPVDWLDVSDNNLPRGSINHLLLQLEASRRASHLRYLSLGGNSLGVDCVNALAASLESGLSSLRTLKLRQIRFPTSSWSVLVPALKFTKVSTLDMADTLLGRHSQLSCISLADYIGESKYLKVLDVSHNNFSRVGFMYLGKAIQIAEKLQNLDLSSNACILSVHESESGVQSVISTAAAGAPPPAASSKFHPILCFIEALENTKALNTLALSNCALGYEADFVLFTAVLNQTKKTLRKLDLSDNPHGLEGMRSLIRLLASDNTGIEWMQFRGSRAESIDLSTSRFLYNFLDPNGSYNLDLANPEHRAVMKQLSFKLNQAPLAERFLEFQYNGKNASPDTVVTFDKNKRPEILDNGSCVFKFFSPDQDTLFERAKDRKWDQQMLIRQWARATKIPLSLTRFVTVDTTYRELHLDEERQMFLRALKDECILRPCQLVQFSSRGLSFLYVVSRLFPAVYQESKISTMDIPFAIRNREDARLVLRAASEFIFFNPNVPDGSYRLWMDNDTDRAVGEYLILINAWHRHVAEATNIPDASQYGNRDNFRNMRLNSNTYRVRNEETGKELLPQPKSGVLELDYVSPLRCSSRSSTARQVTEMMLKGSLVKVKLKVTAGQREEGVKTYNESAKRYMKIVGLHLETLKDRVSVLGVETECPLGENIRRGDQILHCNGISDPQKMVHAMQKTGHWNLCVQPNGFRPGICDILKNSRCSTLQKTYSFRQVAHKITVNTEQIKMILKAIELKTTTDLEILNRICSKINRSMKGWAKKSAEDLANENSSEDDKATPKGSSKSPSRLPSRPTSRAATKESAKQQEGERLKTPEKGKNTSSPPPGSASSQRRGSKDKINASGLGTAGSTEGINGNIDGNLIPQSDHRNFLARKLGVWGKPDSEIGRKLLQAIIDPSAEKTEGKEQMYCRVFMIQILFNRCVDADQLISSRCIYSPIMFHLQEIHSLRSRLGHIRTFNVLQAHHEVKITEIRDPTATSKSRHRKDPLPKSRVPAQKEEKNKIEPKKKDKDKNKDEEKEKSAKEKKRSTNNSKKCMQGVRYQNLHGNEYWLDLSVREDWVVARTILDIAEKEQRLEIKNSQYFLAGEDVEAQFSIPTNWYASYEGLPQLGILTLKLATKSEKCRASIGKEANEAIINSRWEYACTHLGWLDYRKKT